MINKPHYELWNRKKIKEFHKELKDQFGFDQKLDYVFLSNKEKIYIVSREYEKVNLENVKINNIGLYIAKNENSRIRVSIEGSQIIGPHCKKNILEVENTAEWMQGKDITTNMKFTGAVIIKYKTDFLGSGFYKEGKIFNCVPKARRIRC